MIKGIDKIVLKSNNYIIKSNNKMKWISLRTRIFNNNFLNLTVTSKDYTKPFSKQVLKIIINPNIFINEILKYSYWNGKYGKLSKQLTNVIEYVYDVLYDIGIILYEDLKIHQIDVNLDTGKIREIKTSIKDTFGHIDDKRADSKQMQKADIYEDSKYFVNGSRKAKIYDKTKQLYGQKREAYAKMKQLEAQQLMRANTGMEAFKHRFQYNCFTRQLEDKSFYKFFQPKERKIRTEYTYYRAKLLKLGINTIQDLLNRRKLEFLFLETERNLIKLYHFDKKDLPEGRNCIILYNIIKKIILGVNDYDYRDSLHEEIKIILVLWSYKIFLKELCRPPPYKN